MIKKGDVSIFPPTKLKNRNVPFFRRSGSLLIITLWLVAVLSVLAVAIARYLSLEVRLTKYHRAQAQGRVLARSGVYLAMQRLMQDAGEEAEEYDWLGDDWAVFPQADPTADETIWTVPFPEEGEGLFTGTIQVQITDEARKLDVNTAKATELETLVGDAAIAEAIVDAVDVDGEGNWETDPMTAPPYYAKNGPLTAPEELADIPGMTPEAVTALATQTTPYLAADEALNINTVSAEVMRAVGLTESAVQPILDFRATPGAVFKEAGLPILQTLKDRQGVDLTGTEDGNLLQSAVFGVASQTFMAVSEAVVEPPTVRVRIEAIIRRRACEDGIPAPCILAWREG